ncbi:MAG: ankyrin repeat domain-containing protein [Novosphingobium sp.]|nr:ankyrin repeat domain-containing protein [Novosphingobium sp.]
MLDVVAGVLLASAVPVPIAGAIANDDATALRVALETGANANALLDYGESPLARAVEVQDPALVLLLLQHGAKPNLADSNGLTPLALACERGNAAIVDALLEAGADPRRISAEGAWPLALCARFASAETVAKLLARGAKADTADSRGQTPLMWAASAGNAEAAALLIKAGAKVNRITPAGFTPLFFAIASGQAEAVALLVKAGADIRHRGPESTSALQLALYQKNWAAAELLLARGGWDLAEVDRNGTRPLHVAAAAGQGALVAALLAAGADANALTGPSRITWVTEANFGMAPPPVPPTPPLFSAALAGQADVMALLVKAGADPHLVLANGTNLLLAAASSQSADALARALDLAPDVNVADASGVTALHRVLGGPWHPGLEPMLRLLAARNARTDIADTYGRTAAKMVEDGLATVREAYSRVFPQKPPSALALKPL